MRIEPACDFAAANQMVSHPGNEKGSAMATKSSASSTEKEAMPEGDMTPEQRTEFANRLVNRFAIWSGVAGLIPVPVLDVFAVGGLQLQMVRRLSQVYGVAFTENSGKALIASMAGSMIPTTSGIGAASTMKFVPVIGTLTAGVVMPTLSAGATYAIGKAFIQHFESGGTLLDFNTPDYREFLRSQKEMWESRSKSSGGAAASSA